MRRLGKPDKRVLASLLAAGMLASMMPAGALADESVGSGQSETTASDESDVVTGEPVATSEEGPAEPDVPAEENPDDTGDETT